MTDPDGLDELLDPERAKAVRLALGDVGCTINVDTSTSWRSRGFTGAVLAPVIILLAQGEHPKPERCLAKICPPEYARESARHFEAHQRSKNHFVRKHLVKPVFHPVRCSDGSVITFQEIAGGSLKGSRLLSQLSRSELGQACAIVRESLLEEWTGERFRVEQGKTIAELLKLELGRCIDGEDGWLRKWAESRGLLAPGCTWIRFDGYDRLPNPFALIEDDVPTEKVAYLEGRCHGDLHGDNILIPSSRGVGLDPGRFRLIDLSDFGYWLPLSRDVATLMISTLTWHVRDLPTWQADALSDYLIGEATAGLVTVPPYLVDVVDALRCDAGKLHDKGWTQPWEQQLKVSWLAQAMRHSAYDNLGQDGRWWSLRLATRLAGSLAVGGRDDGAEPCRLGPEVCAEGAGGSGRSNARNAVLPGGTHPSAPVGDRGLLNRDDERAQLAKALSADGSGIVVVTGTHGVGKSRLLECVLEQDARRDGKVHRYEATRVRGFDLKKLVEAMEEAVAPADRVLVGETPLDRLKAAITALNGSRIVIVVESAENMLDDRHTVQDTDLDEILEVISNTETVPVKVVFVSREVPRSGNRNSWPLAARPVPVLGLPAPSFSALLGRIDPERHGLASLSDTEQSLLHAWLLGNPLLARLLNGIVTVSESEIRVSSVMQRLSSVPRRDIPQFLSNELIHSLGSGQRWVISALAAFSSPVDEGAVIELLEDHLEREKVRAALDRLMKTELVRRTDGQYVISGVDVEDVLANPPIPKATLLRAAAKVLRRRQKPLSEIVGIPDLEIHFARVDILLSAKSYGVAHEIMEQIDPILHRWNQADKLYPQRVIVAKQLADDFAEMQNCNALGHIYVSRGRFDAAINEYQDALRHARNAEADDRAVTKIYINIATLHREHNETRLAAKHYSDALAMARTQGELEDEVMALEGLADCDRRWGRYAEAIENASAALLKARGISFSRAVHIALKLSRWHAELGSTPEAFRLLEVAQEMAAEHADESLRVACLDGRADLLVDGGDLEGAMSTARRAVSIALEQRAPVILLQARTTLCFGYLHLDDTKSAREQIDLAAAFRRSGRSLVVLALQALVALEQGDKRMASKLFRGLSDEAKRRRSADDRDFAARYFEGLAICGQVEFGVSLEPAVRAIERARDQTPSTPGVMRRLAFIVDRIGRHRPRRDRFKAVLDVLRDAKET